MRIIDVMLKDLTQITRDWQAALFLVLMPVAFTFLMGFVFGGAGGGDVDPRLPVGVLAPPDDPAAVALVALLELSDAIRPVPAEMTADELATAAADDDFVAAVIVPAGFGDALFAGEMLPVEVVPGSGNAGHTAEIAIRGALFRLHSAAATARLNAERAVADGGEAYFYDLLAETVAAWEEPPFGVDVTLATELAVEEERSTFDNPYTHSSAGMMVQFAIAGLISAAQVIVSERNSRTFQRLMTTTLSKAEAIAGHYLAIFVMVFLQLALLMTFGHLVLGVAYFNAPLASLVTAVSFSLFVGALGLLIGVLAKSEEQAIIFSLFPMFILAGLGGAWMPLEFSSETFRTIGHLLPTAWAMDALKDITVRGLGLESVLLPAVILVGFAVACLLAAIWQFRTE